MTDPERSLTPPESDPDDLDENVLDDDEIESAGQQAADATPTEDDASTSPEPVTEGEGQ